MRIKRTWKKVIALASAVMLMIPGQVAFAASSQDPLVSATISTSTAYAYMSIGGEVLPLKIMFISQQVLKADATTVCAPQNVISNTGSTLSGTIAPRSGYIFVNCTYSYYVDFIRMAQLFRTV